MCRVIAPRAATIFREVTSRTPVPSFYAFLRTPTVATRRWLRRTLRWFDAPIAAVGKERRRTRLRLVVSRPDVPVRRSKVAPVASPPPSERVA
jgi:hypothetical protein